MPGYELPDVREALVAAGVTGTHRSHPREKNLAKIDELLRGEPDATFGISGLGGIPRAEVLRAMARVTGCSPHLRDTSCDDLIDPELTMRGLTTAARRLRDAADKGATLMVGTGHPAGVLELHIHVADAFVRRGGKLLCPREEHELRVRGKAGRIRYVAGVACLANGGLRHTHRADAMEAMLEERPWPDLVLGDHGFAGAAIERDIPTIAIVDINDHALAVVEEQGRDVTLVPLDDNRNPSAYEPAWRVAERIILE